MTSSLLMSQPPALIRSSFFRPCLISPPHVSPSAVQGTLTRAQPSGLGGVQDDQGRGHLHRRKGGALEVSGEAPTGGRHVVWNGIGGWGEIGLK